mmetsp:Transcript_18394/g.19151  ORF Transcript_18394/g.19151 Transcript_18394/m.19151 type:complete len:170 (+) Transcript_18394:53-562(+)
MHNIWVRLNAVTFFAISVLMGLATLCCLSTFNHVDVPVVKTLKLNNIRSLRNHGGTDQALFSFDINADLTPVWHWNSHILFVYLVAEYPSDANVLNQVVVWDKIIKSKSGTKIKETNQFVKYPLKDQGSELRGKEVTLKLLIDHMPITGPTYPLFAGNHTFKLPSKYKL